MMHTLPIPPCGAILAAGGTGSRMAADQPKQLLPLVGLPILARSCRLLGDLPEVAEIVVVTPAAHRAACEAACQDFLPAPLLAHLRFAQGGKTRQDSVRAGLRALSPDLSLVLVHDAARPLADAALLRRCLEKAAQTGAAIAAVPATDTIKEVDEQGRILASPDRSRLWQAQTPQIVRRELLEQAFALAEQEGFQTTDEASLLEHAGIPVFVAEGDPKNLKITRPSDLRIARALLENEKQDSAMKIGHGFDAHRLVAGRKLILGGVEIAHPLGLLGHSDADVLCHALMDAILGALGLGDIGRHFPDRDPAYQDANSLHLLEQVWRMAAERGFALGNADLTVICQQPKLAPYLPAMQDHLARACMAPAERVNVKATTTEGMGFTGRKEGIAAHALVLLEETHAS